MKKIFCLFICCFLISCGSLVHKALERVGVLDDKVGIEFRSSETKDLAFIYMKHIGTEMYYQNARLKIDSLQKEGFLVFFEGIANSNKTDSIINDVSKRKIRKVLGINTTEYYDTITNKIAGKIKYRGDKKIINQPSYSNLGVDTLNAIRGDVELKFLINEFENRYGEIILTECDYSTPLDAQEFDCDVIEEELQEKFREKIVLDYRNEALAKKIIEHDSKKALVIYGANHFKGLWEELSKIDSTWQYDNSFPDYKDRIVD